MNSHQRRKKRRADLRCTPQELAFLMAVAMERVRFTLWGVFIGESHVTSMYERMRYRGLVCGTSYFSGGVAKLTPLASQIV